MVLILEFLIESLTALFDFLLIYVEGQQVNPDGARDCFVDDICRFELSYPRMPQDLFYTSHRAQSSSGIFGE
jgi:hypothetical protein